MKKRLSALSSVALVTMATQFLPFDFKADAGFGDCRVAIHDMRMQLSGCDIKDTLSTAAAKFEREHGSKLRKYQNEFVEKAQDIGGEIEDKINDVLKNGL